MQNKHFTHKEYLNEKHDYKVVKTLNPEETIA
jgi:hypothetical protein